MDVREAVKKAKQYVVDLFEAEGVTNVGLEEAIFDTVSNSWKITIGFSRHWDHKGPFATAILDATSRRSFKVLQINDESGEIESLKDRVLAASE